MTDAARMPQSTTGAEAVHWDLSDLFESEASLDAGLARAEAGAQSFAAKYKSQIHTLSAEALREALEAYESLQDTLGRAYTYAYLYWSTDTNSAERGALLQKVREAYTQISQQLLFFELEWVHGAG